MDNRNPENAQSLRPIRRNLGKQRIMQPDIDQHDLRPRMPEEFPQPQMAPHPLQDGQPRPEGRPPPTPVHQLQHLPSFIITITGILAMPRQHTHRSASGHPSPQVPQKDNRATGPLPGHLPNILQESVLPALIWLVVHALPTMACQRGQAR